MFDEMKLMTAMTFVEKKWLLVPNLVMIVVREKNRVEIGFSAKKAVDNTVAVEIGFDTVVVAAEVN